MSLTLILFCSGWLERHVGPYAQGMKKATSLASAFYEEASLVATSLGVSIDMFVISKAPVGLDVLSTIANNTGGGVWLYPSVQDAMLTQVCVTEQTSSQMQKSFEDRHRFAQNRSNPKAYFALKPAQSAVTAKSSQVFV